ncbi:hypothetical protein [Amycolatopsis sp. H20-H5]|uniref:hypothetical protein n=1 Tax=Amycolatopsis sp. H20-H5 TaxID=3046309 RepID=UPI002DBD6544|nr:hypothetical protein [Amycolatopsis sp. H20-H5]MEC3978042.1 hypothetical protein [Amycolatopsis sp. H20-H5]
MLFGGERTRSVLSALDTLGFERLLALPAVPVNNPRRMRYPVSVTTSVDDEQWYVRSFGTGFDLVDPIRRGSLGRWYSLGWGLVDDLQAAELLMVHAGETDAGGLPSLAEGLAVEITEQCATRSESCVRPGRWGTELRISAVFDRMPEGRC